MEGFFILFVGIALYFIPSIIASNRAHRNRGAIYALNIFLGWSLIGWVAALVWSLSETAAPSQPDTPQRLIDKDPYSKPVPQKRIEPKGYPTYLAGLAHCNPGETTTRGARAKKFLAKGQILELVPEPDNKADEDAIAVYRQGYRYGYIPARHDWVARAIAEGREVEAEITAIEKADDPEAQVFVKLRLTIAN